MDGRKIFRFRRFGGGRQFLSIVGGGKGKSFLFIGIWPFFHPCIISQIFCVLCFNCFYYFLDGLGVYHTDSGYSEVIPSSSSYNSVADINTKVEKTQSSSLSNLPSQTNSMLSNSVNSCNTPVVSSMQPSYSQPLHQNFALSPGNYSPVRRVSLSDASIHQGSQLNMTESRQNLVETKPVTSVLPVYRQAPDYDTAVKLKYGVQRYKYFLINYFFEIT